MIKCFRMRAAARLIFSVVLLVWTAEMTLAVTSKVTYHRTSEELLKGEAEDVVISSKGTLQLGRTWEELASDFNDVWSINSIVLSGGKVYIGTSPNGGIFQYSLGKIEQVYSARAVNEATDEEEVSGDEPSDANNSGDANESGEVIKADEQLANEHIFAMATDISGRLLVGISGRRCALSRLEGGELKTVYEPNDAKYIFAITVADNGRIFLGTGPKGKIYALDSGGKEAKLIYDSSDKNILSLAVAEDGSLLAGTDTRGLVYRIDTETGKATVLYDSDQPEVTALLVTAQGEVYAAATSAQVVAAQKQFARQVPLAGRPESAPEANDDNKTGKGSTKLKIANTNKNTKDNKRSEDSGRKPAKPDKVSHLYRISAEGFVTDVFAEPAVLFTLAQQGSQLLLGTGNEAELFTIDPTTERSAVIYKDKQASQITAVTISGGDIYIGTANPAKLIKVGGSYAQEGTYISDLVDASQPANWGKLQIEADIPANCGLTVASRSGNVKDVNDPTFSDWTDAVDVTAPVQLGCPMGRYCQYKLTLSTADGSDSPVVREIAVASTIPNLAPKVHEVETKPIEKPDKQGHFEIKYKARDDNGDTLIYTIDFRKLGRQGWIELAKDLDKPSYEWDGRTVEDGRYEIRVTASDERSNSTATKMTGSRVSDPVVIDNTGPVIEIQRIRSEKEVTLIEPVEIYSDSVEIQLAVVDRLSAVGELNYTIDSNTEWKGAVPQDLVFDTTNEQFTIKIEDLKAGEHVVAMRAKDSLGNTTYKTIELNVIDE